MFYRGKKRARKEPDAFQKTFSGAFDRLSGLGLALLLLFLGLVALGGILLVTSNRSASRETEAQSRLVAAMEQTDPVKRSSDLEKLAGDSGGTLAAPTALLLDATLLEAEAIRAEGPARAEKLKSALAKLDEFLPAHAGHPLAPLARERRALVLEDMGDFQAAADAFSAGIAAVEKTDFAYLKGKMLYGLARCQEKLNKRSDAIENLDRALSAANEYSNSPWRPSASALLAQLRPAPKNLLLKGVAEDKPAAAAGDTETKPAPEKPDGKKPEKNAGK